jgi:hypothetical protein
VLTQLVRFQFLAGCFQLDEGMPGRLGVVRRDTDEPIRRAVSPDPLNLAALAAQVTYARDEVLLDF